METVEFDRAITEEKPRLTIDEMIRLVRIALSRPVEDTLQDVDDPYYQLFLPRYGSNASVR